VKSSWVILSKIAKTMCIFVWVMAGAPFRRRKLSRHVSGGL
jgi:hypothetical protein